MYKVILIDDEPIILEGLTRTIPWGQYNCEVVGTARDGKEGISLIRECHPDMMVTDISMGNMDGLRLIAGVKAEFPHMRVTILTAYRDFEYAQQAVRLGVDRFILKPSTTEEIGEAISAMVKKLEDEAAEKAVAVRRTAPAPSSPAAGATVRIALEYIQAHYMEKVYLADAAEHAYVSQWYLSKMLHKTTGKSFPDLLNSVRVREAKKLLQDPDLRVSEVAARVGFADPAHFARAFKRETGMSANEYRKRGITEGLE